MTIKKPEASLLHHSLFIISKVIVIEGRGDLVDSSQLKRQHSIIALTKGSGVLRVNGVSWKLQPGISFIAQPGSQVELELTEGAEFAGYWVTFDIYHLGVSEQQCSEKQDYFPYGQPLNPAPLIKFVDMLEQLAGKQQNTGELERFKQQIRLQELIVFLLENHQSSQSQTDSIQAVERSVTYLEDHYIESITVEQLSQLAGVRRWEYSTLFQGITGHKPLDYLTEVRMKRAKELLLLTNDPLREIAQRVGFKDEYYFNRRFRQSMGISPKQYARSQQNRVSIKDYLGSPIELPLLQARIVVIGYALGHLLALGVRPIGADLTVIGKQVVYRNELDDIADVGMNGDYETIKALKPDFIFHCSKLDPFTDHLSNIAPTLVIDREDSNFEQLRLIASVVGKKQKAEKWIKHYETKAKSIWSQFQLSAGCEQTATALVMVQGKLFLMGNHGLSLTLYQPFAFKPPQKVREMIEQQIDFARISADRLAAYAGDRLFLLVAEDALSTKGAKQLMDNPLWQELPAVRNDLVHVADAKWNYADSITVNRLLTVLPDILRNSS